MSAKSRFTYPQFQYVDTAMGGANKRNKPTRLDALPKCDRPDCYTSMFRFREDYLQLCQSSGSVAGADQLECWVDYLWFDIDSANLDEALTDAQTLIRGLLTLVEPEHIVVYFSGSKGFHIGVNSQLFGFEPSVALPQMMRKLAMRIAERFEIKSVDKAIYNHNRLWRIPNTIHGKTKLHKSELGAEKFPSLSLDDVITSAKSGKRPAPAYRLAKKAEPIERLVQLREEAAKDSKKHKTTTGENSDWVKPVLEGKPLQAVLLALKNLLAKGVGAGGRDDAGLMRAAECRKAGFDERETRERLYTWNELNQPPMDEADLERIIKSAYSRVYDFGYDNAELKEAREEAWEAIKSGNLPDMGNLVQATVNGRKEEPPIIDSMFTDNEKAEASEWETIIQNQKRRGRRTLTPALHGPALADFEPEPVQRDSVLFWDGLVNLFSAAPKSGKSILTTSAAADLLRNDSNAILLYVNGEESLDTIVRRFRPAFGKELLCSGRVLLQRKPDSFLDILINIRHFRPTHLIIDTNSSVFSSMGVKPPETHQNEEWQAQLQWWGGVIELSTVRSVVILEHSPKRSSGAIGSVGKGAGVDVLTDGEKFKKDRFMRLIIQGRGYDQSEPEEYRYDGPLYDVSRDIRRNPDRGRIIEELCESDRKLCTALIDGKRLLRSEVATITNLSKSSLTEMRGRLKDRGLLTVVVERGKERWFMTKGQIAAYGQYLQNGDKDE